MRRQFPNIIMVILFASYLTKQGALVLGDILVGYAQFPCYAYLMRGKIQLLRYLCTQIADEGSRSDMPLTQEECEAVISCVQELELHVLQQDRHTA
jgi:hypothetical protein